MSREILPGGLTLRDRLQAGDLGRLIELHGKAYASEPGFDLKFEAFVATGVQRSRGTLAWRRLRVRDAPHRTGEYAFGALGRETPHLRHLPASRNAGMVNNPGSGYTRPIFQHGQRTNRVLLLPASLSYFDLLLRAATAGPLLLAAALLIWRYRTAEHLSLAMLCFCFACYLGLTAPAANDFPALRLITLAGTHLAGIALWFYAIHAFNSQCHTGNWPRWLKAAVTCFLLWHTSYFLLLGGQGLYHDFSQVLAVALSAHVLWLAVRGFDEELSSGYRLARVSITLIAAVSMLLLAVNEFTRSVPVRQPVVSLITANLLFVLVYGICLAALSAFKEAPQNTGIRKTESGQSVDHDPIWRKLKAFVEAGRYTESGLTIASLARSLDVPEHKLRRVINQQQGYRNFSQFLNHYRITRAQQQLADPALRDTSILTLALELGYGSIGPFNRAFREQTGLTPTQFRQSAR